MITWLAWDLREATLSPTVNSEDSLPLEAMTPTFEYHGYIGNLLGVLGRAIRKVVSVPGLIRVQTVSTSTSFASGFRNENSSISTLPASLKTILFPITSPKLLFSDESKAFP